MPTGQSPFFSSPSQQITRALQVRSGLLEAESPRTEGGCRERESEGQGFDQDLGDSCRGWWCFGRLSFMCYKLSANCQQPKVMTCVMCLSSPASISDRWHLTCDVWFSCANSLALSLCVCGPLPCVSLFRPLSRVTTTSEYKSLCTSIQITTD